MWARGKHIFRLFVQYYISAFINLYFSREQIIQQQLHFCSNPYATESRPGTALAVLGTGAKKSPVSGTLDLTNMPALSEEHQYLSDSLLSIVASLNSLTLSATEKRQASESEKGVAIFIKTMARGHVDGDVMNKVGNMLGAMQNRDYGTASSGRRVRRA